MSSNPHNLHAVATAAAPAPLQGAPYSQAIVANGFAFVSGQVGIDPRTGDLIPGDVAAQSRRALLNVKAILEGAGSDLDHLVKVNVYLADLADWPAMNDAYAELVREPCPARAAVQAGLPAGVLVEIDAIAQVSQARSRRSAP